MARPYLSDEGLWERIERAVEKVKDRLLRVSRALEEAGIPYAVAGGNAVQMWVARVDEAAARNTRDVDILLRRSDLDSAIEALRPHGFRYVESLGVSMFLDGEGASPRDAVQLVFAGEKTRDGDPLPAPGIEEVESVRDVRTVTLEALVRMKLVAFRRKDQTHLTDMLELGLIDATWLERVPPALRSRLQEILDSPEG